MSYVINTIQGSKVNTTQLENIDSDTIDVKDTIDMHNNNIINVSNINLSTINNLPYQNGTTSSNGKYSQICLPPDAGQKSGNGQVIIDGDNTDTNTAVSIIDGTAYGSLVFTPAELSLGSSYHAKIGGLITSNTQNMELNISVYLGSTVIYTTAINNEDIQIDNLSSVNYTYECDLDFTVNRIGTNGHIYCNGQVLYVTGRNNNDLRGSSSEQETELDLSSNLIMDIKMRWETAADTDEIVTNKMVRVTKMF
jgi:hypothetical protein